MSLDLIPSPFETQHLGRNSARLSVPPAFGDLEMTLVDKMEDARREGFGFVSCRITEGEPEIETALEKTGFRKIESLATYFRTIKPVPEVEGRDAVVPAPSSAAVACAAIAERAFSFDRFHADPRIPDQVADAIKAAWAENSFNGRADARLVVEDQDGEIAGFIFCLRDGDDSVIDLIAVKLEARHQGYGRALVTGALAHYDGRAEGMRAGTQLSNSASIKIYESLGFVRESVAHTYHWMDGNE